MYAYAREATSKQQLENKPGITLYTRWKERDPKSYQNTIFLLP